MICFLVTGFKGFWPVGTCAVVYAEDREQCKRDLKKKLIELGLGQDSPDEWTIEPLTPVPEHRYVRIISDGAY
jgi:hypothetical protein